jgi:dienelactone hydrolase/lysophospholipase L1-like esterase
MLRPALFVVAVVLATDRPAAAQAEPKADLPKVVLVGDSIRLGYAPLVARRLEGKAVIISDKENGGDSANVLKHLKEWTIQQKPAVVHFNCGLHDLKQSKKTKKHQVEQDQYEANLKEIVRTLQKESSAAIVFASTTPINDERHAQRKTDFDRTEADVQKYNQVARAVMHEAHVPVHDLHWVVQQGGAARLLGGDGTHYTKEGNERLADAVADCILRQLITVQYRPVKGPASGPEAAAEYRKTEKERDGQVPAAFKNMKFGEFALPESAATWKERRPEVLKKVVGSLGDLPPRPAPLQVRRVTRELRRSYTLEKIVIDNGVDGEVTALLLIPDKRQEPAPALLWLHSSTPDKTQILVPDTNGGLEPLGEVFVKAGYVVLSPDAYWHGDRTDAGPAGTLEPYSKQQESLLKLNLWLGRTLWGMFVRDDQIALDYLSSRPEVDRKRIGATGMSMGSTRAWWLAAVDDRVAAVVGVACLTRYQNLIAHGQLRAHGVYYFVNGLLRHFDTEGVVALVAPRPYLALTGDLDAGSPADGIKIIEERVGKVYDVMGAKDHFRNVLYPDIGHTYTPEMRKEMLAWFERWLKPGAN